MATVALAQAHSIAAPYGFTDYCSVTLPSHSGLIKTLDGGYILFADSLDLNSYDRRNESIVKAAGNGGIQWIRHNLAGEKFLSDCVQTADGGYLFVGSARGGNGYQDADDALVIRTDAEGNVQWSRSFGGNYSDWLESAAVADGGGYVLAGTSDSFGPEKGTPGSSDIYVIRIDDAGNKVWEKAYDICQDDYGMCIMRAPDGGYVIAGDSGSAISTSSPSIRQDPFLLKIDGNGNEIWEKAYCGSGYNGASSVTCTADGGYALAGFSDPGGYNNGSMCLVKTDGSGVQQWARTLPWGNASGAYSVIQAGDGNYVLAGFSREPQDSDPKGYFVMADASGNIMWRCIVGRGYLSRVADAGNGTFACSGFTGGTALGATNFSLIKVNPQTGNGAFLGCLPWLALPAMVLGIAAIRSRRR